jgi:DNA-binding NarL/FixJ family response regulator
MADDNADMRQYLTRLLCDRYEVHAVADGRQALEAIQQLRPALVLADVMMPRLDGFGLLRVVPGREARQISRLIGRLHAPGFNTRKVQKCVDELEQSVRVAANRNQLLMTFRIKLLARLCCTSSSGPSISGHCAFQKINRPAS